MSKREMKRKRWNLISAFISLFTIGMLCNCIKIDGIADFAFTLEIFYLISALLLSWLPDFMSRLIRSRMGKDQFKNAEKVSKTMFIYAMIAGITGCLVLFILSVIMEGHPGLLGNYTYLCMRNFAVCFLLFSMIQAFAGYFQGKGTGLPRFVCGFILQIVGIPIILLMAQSEYAYGEKVGNLLQNSTLAGNYGAIGAARGFLIMYLFMLLVMVLLYFLMKRNNSHTKEGMRLNEDGRDILAMALKNEGGHALCSFFLQAVVFTGLILFYAKMSDDGLPSFGIFYGNYFVLIGMETIFILYVLIPAGQELITAYRKEEQRNMQQLSSVCILILILCGLFMSFMNLTLTECLAQTFFGKKVSTELFMLIRAGSFTPMFLSAGLFYLQILKETGKNKKALLCTAVPFAGFVVVVSVALKVMNGSILSLVAGVFLYSVILSVLTGFMVSRFLSFRIEWVRMVLMPIICAAVTGGCMLGLTKVLESLSAGLITLIISIAVGILLYVFLLLLLRCIRKKDLVCFPMSSLITFIGNLLNLLS